MLSSVELREEVQSLLKQKLPESDYRWLGFSNCRDDQYLYIDIYHIHQGIGGDSELIPISLDDKKALVEQAEGFVMEYCSLFERVSFECQEGTAFMRLKMQDFVSKLQGD